MVTESRPRGYPEDDDEFVAEQFDLVDQQALRYIEVPCHYHAYRFGVGSACVPRFSSATFYGQ